jgi:SAM-dependent methyltransferase
MSIDAIDYSLHYRRWHSEDDAHFDAVAGRLQRWLGPYLHDIAPDARVLDYGCGFGLLLNYLRTRFAAASGVDASAQQVQVARARGLDARHVPIDAYADWAETHREQYDVVFLFDVLEHLPQSEQMLFLRRLAATLKPGGTMFVKVPNASSPLASRWRYIDWTHWSSFTEPSLDFVCLHAGLQDIRYLRDDSSTPPRWPWLPRWGLRHYYLKTVVRAFWRLYTYSELGEPNVHFGLNLLVRANKPSTPAGGGMQVRGK